MQYRRSPCLLVLSVAVLLSSQRAFADAPLDRMARGIGALERYEYKEARDVFAALTKAHPKWEAAWVNLGLAALNLQSEENLEECEAAFRRAIAIQPRSCHALVGLGVLYRHQNRMQSALDVFEKAARIDSEDPFILYFLGSTRADLGQHVEARRDLEKAILLQPSFASALYRLGSVYARLGKEGRKKRVELLKRFRRLDQDGVGIKTGVKYGEGGRYSYAIRGTAPPGHEVPSTEGAVGFGAQAPLFGQSSTLDKPFDERGLDVLTPDDWNPLASAAVGDLNGDGQLDAVFSFGVYLDFGDERESALQLALLPAGTFALGDLDGDRDLDQVRASADRIDVWLNGGEADFARAEAPGLEAWKQDGARVERLCLIDVDSDWDLDIAVLWRAGKECRLQVFANLQNGEYRDIAPDAKLAEPGLAANEMVWADFDGDLDLDLLLIDGDTGSYTAWANDRTWIFRPVELAGLEKTPGVTSVIGDDLDRDGDLDLLLLGERLRLLRNEGGFRFAADVEFAERHGALGGSTAVVFDFLGKLLPSVIVLDPATESGRPRFLSTVDAEVSVEVELPGLEPLRRGESLACAASFGKGAQPSLLVAEKNGRVRTWPIETPTCWIALDLRGPGLKELEARVLRSNSAGIGAVVEVHAGGQRLTKHVLGGAGGRLREATRVTSGLGAVDTADYARILWPDGVLQSEVGLGCRKLHRIEEVERKPSSCPVLFVWNGEAFECVADFLGVGGLGYFEAPGQYATPDPTELLLLPETMQPRRGVDGKEHWELRILEPLEECTYLDQASLLAVDSPEDVTVLPLEMYAVRGPRPDYELLAFRDAVQPESVRDAKGRDYGDALTRVDREYAPRLVPDRRFPGTLREDYALTLEFADGAIDQLLEKTEGERGLWLCLHGYIEYGYSTSNFAAWQSGFVPRAPTFSVERGGQWVPLREEWGFPAGYPRWMVVDLRGLLRAGDRRLRIETNLEIGWDRVLLASALRLPATPGSSLFAGAEIHVRELRPTTSDLHWRGFPPLPDPFSDIEGFAYRDFTSFDHYRAMPGAYTRYGEVGELLAAADDELCVFGPGDELTLTFPRAALPKPAPGVRRSLIWKCFGWCKDMDLYTGEPDGVEPLPFRGMTAYPLAGDEVGSVRERRAAYRARWNTREVEAGARTAVRDLEVSDRGGSPAEPAAAESVDEPE